MISLIVIGPAEMWPAVRASNAALGYEVDDGVALSPTGAEPATHRAVHTPVDQSYIDIVTGTVDPPGFDPAQVAAVRAALITDTGEGEPAERFAVLIAANGLQLVGGDV